MIREERRKKRQLKNYLRGFFIAVLAGGLIGIVGVTVFVVEDVEVEGNILYDSQMIEDAVLNDDYSWNSLYVYLKYRFIDTEEIPFVDTMEISMKNPHTLHITVYEKGMMGYLFINGIGENAYFDKDGFVVETSSEVIPGVPKVEGINCSEVVLYEKLPMESSKLREILTLTQALKRNDLIPDSIEYGVPNAPVVYYGNVQVQIGSTSDLTQKVERIAKILPSVKDMSGVLHLENWTEDTTNIIFDKN